MNYIAAARGGQCSSAVEQRFRKPSVAGSIPAIGSIPKLWFSKDWQFQKARCQWKLSVNRCSSIIRANALIAVPLLLEAGGALQALARALVKRGYPCGVIHHSDCGIQYASALYQEQLRRCGLLASMSRKANCYDNAAMEAFWSTLKHEALEESAHWSKDRVRRAIFEYIEAIYNRKRLHSSLGYRSPVDFENQNN